MFTLIDSFEVYSWEGIVRNLIGQRIRLAIVPYHPRNWMKKNSTILQSTSYFNVKSEWTIKWANIRPRFVFLCPIELT